MKPKLIFCIFTILFFVNTVNADEVDWITEEPPRLPNGESRHQLQFLEVGVSKLSIAIREYLNEHPYIELSSSHLAYYNRGLPIKHKSKHVILVRGIYMNGELGQFIVSQNKDNVWVRFGTYGNESKLEKSALIVFVDSLPEKIYITTDTR